MDFLAYASFGTGIVLSVIGTASINRAQSSSQFVFACIPLFFSFQQTSEGFLWLSISDSSHAYISHFATYLFLIFSQIIWPLLMPVSIFLLEQKEILKKILMLLIACWSI
jgi:hypothetical protein